MFYLFISCYTYLYHVFLIDIMFYIYAPITSDECHTWFHLYGSSPHISKNIKMKNSCKQRNSYQRPSDSEANATSSTLKDLIGNMVKDVQQDVFVNHYVLQQGPKKLFWAQRSQWRSQEHGPCCHLKGHLYLNMCAKYRTSIPFLFKRMLKLTTDRQTDRQTDRKKTTSLELLMRGHKNLHYI